MLISRQTNALDSALLVSEGMKIHICGHDITFLPKRQDNALLFFDIRQYFAPKQQALLARGVVLQEVSPFFLKKNTTWKNLQLINVMAYKVLSAISVWKKQNHNAPHATHWAHLVYSCILTHQQLTFLTQNKQPTWMVRCLQTPEIGSKLSVFLQVKAHLRGSHASSWGCSHVAWMEVWTHMQTGALTGLVVPLTFLAPPKFWRVLLSLLRVTTAVL